MTTAKEQVAEMFSAKDKESLEFDLNRQKLAEELGGCHRENTALKEENRDLRRVELEQSQLVE